MNRIVKIIPLIALVLILVMGGAAEATFDPDVDYSLLMIHAAMRGDFEAGRSAEQTRLEKIKGMGLYDEAVFSFDDLMLLAKIIQAEAGSSWLSDEWKMRVGEVVLNRVASPEFPDSIHDVIFQRGQYAGVNSNWFRNLLPSERSAHAALRVLRGERLMVPSVVFQANFTQGSGTHLALHCRILGWTFFGYSSRPELY